MWKGAGWSTFSKVFKHYSRSINFAWSDSNTGQHSAILIFRPIVKYFYVRPSPLFPSYDYFFSFPYFFIFQGEASAIKVPFLNTPLAVAAATVQNIVTFDVTNNNSTRRCVRVEEINYYIAAYHQLSSTSESKVFSKFPSECNTETKIKICLYLLKLWKTLWMVDTFTQFGQFVFAMSVYSKVPLVMNWRYLKQWTKELFIIYCYKINL